MAKKKDEEAPASAPTHRIEFKIKGRPSIVMELSGTLYDQHMQADKDYEISRDFIHTHFIHIWNKGIKSYLLHTGDRQSYIKDWQSNIRLGMIRTNIDIYSSFLETSNLQFIVNGLSEKAFELPRGNNDPLGRTRIDFARNYVNCVADRTRFADQSILGLIEGAQIGVTILRTLYKKVESKSDVLTMINNEFQMVSYEDEEINTPYTISVDPYTVFPDPFSYKDPRYVCERAIVSPQSCLETYKYLINHESNLLKDKEGKPLITDEILREIMACTEKRDITDFSNIRYDIYAYENAKFSKTDKLYKGYRPGRSARKLQDQDDLVEVRYTEYKDRIVLKINSIPVYIGPNIYGKIMYDFVQAYHTRYLLSEGPAYLQFGLEDTQDSFFNNTVDNARAAAHARWIGDKNAFNGTPEVMDLPPGGVMWGDRPTQDSLRAMPTPPVTDAGLISLTDVYAQKATGISEIDSGRASKLRVAAEGAALAAATNRRMNGYVKRYLSTIGQVGEKWIKLFKHHNPTMENNQWAYTKDVDGTVTTFDINPKDLDGSYHVTLDAQALFAMSGESAISKKLEMLSRFEKYMTPEQTKRFMQSIFRDAGLNPTYYLPDAEPIPEAPLNPKENQIDTSMLNTVLDVPPEVQAGREMAQDMNTQPDFGNGGNGRATA